MKLDLRIGRAVDHHEIAALAARAERLRAAAIWSSEAGHDPFLLALDAIATTSTVQVGTGVAVCYARTPMATATAAWDLQRRGAGRFVLGLGTQVPQHVERRYGTRWRGSRAPMREYVAVLRHIWTTWQDGTAPAFEGHYHRFTLSNPEFDPGPLPARCGPPAVWLAAVGPAMARLCGEIADGIHVHSFHTPQYLATTFLPAVAQGAADARRAVPLPRSSPVFAGVARNAHEEATLREHFARHVGFYASTPAYRIVLESGGWEDVHHELRELTRAGRWAELGTHVPAEMLDAFVTIAEPRELGVTLATRYGGLLDQLGLYRGGDQFMHEDDWDVLGDALTDTTT